ncbi:MULTISPECIES: phosphoribosyltransferase domain-containing protein [Pseudomonas]|uniref:Phosphoribosyltransferase n=1 Tax=Pseudomonas weihenstephanensis TaxID=1608994 RepID=A0ABS1ZLN3_9PSED|nr:MULTISPECIES: phosphoribosyltransferase domain-containing protein [Pseudomonas]KVV06473.1 Phosphoribosyl transferase domain protein [Pseudomonas sp. TAD18]KVV07999.1 Phosphoribosyl transferase domain protein [Pseudomonas sp. TAA207]MBM1197272.1 phosphoribosyltransferase [Pseudomonas weihenstephanensis]
MNSGNPLTDSKALHANLKRGRLVVEVNASTFDPQALFSFAERRNPKRAFLFVSRVLGRHIPARPSLMADSFNALAAHIPSDLPGPVLVIGMAETAVGLGGGVHRALSQTRDDSVYLVSTRHPTGSELFARFEEEHSHASSHLLHLPQDPKTRELMLTARSLVLVDDEASTGNTFINLSNALAEAGLSNIERLVTVTLTDWSQDAVRKELGQHVTSVSLLDGRYTFDEDPTADLPEMPEVGSVAQGDWPLDANRDWGRMGVREHLDTLAPDLEVTPGERILVVGTSEFVWRPFLLAERLEKAGADVHFSSTSRSPIALGHAIDHALSFSDNYGLGIPNFLYNVAPGQFDRVLICSETPAAAVDPALISALNAQVIVDDK